MHTYDDDDDALSYYFLLFERLFLVTDIVLNLLHLGT